MSQLPQSSLLLRRVARRMRAAAFGRRFFGLLLALAGAVAVVVLASRLSGLFRLELSPGIVLGSITAAAALTALAWHHRPTASEAARHVDRFAGTKDLFLTVSMLESTAGEYQPLVVRDAEAKAGTLDPAAVVPFHAGKPAPYAVGASIVLVLIAAQLWLPQFDPFGKVAAAEQVETQTKELTESRKATRHRAAQLQRSSDESEAENSEEVAKAIQELKTSLNRMKPAHKPENAQALAVQQKALGGKWQQLNAEGLKNLMKQVADGQQFGGASQKKLEKWARELQEGSTAGLQKELEELQQDLERLAATKDPVKRAEIAQRLKKRLRDLEEFASEKANSQPLTAALERAMKQLEMGQFEGLSDEALEAAEQSLNLAKLELKEIAQSAKDLKKLEEALKVIQMAKKLNGEDRLDGEACQSCISLEDYAELYAELMQGQMPGDQQEGLGGDPEAEDDSVESGFKTEQSKSPITAGKVLLSLKTKGLSDRGDAVKAYRDNVATIRQGVSEAIDQEQIPPGYHEGIKSYFDTLQAPAEPE